MSKLRPQQPNLASNVLKQLRPSQRRRLSQALQQDVLHVAGVQVREVDQRLTHHLVERELVRVLRAMPNPRGKHRGV